MPLRRKKHPVYQTLTSETHENIGISIAAFRLKNKKQKQQQQQNTIWFTNGDFFFNILQRKAKSINNLT